MRKSHIDKDNRQDLLMLWSDFLNKMLWYVLGKHFTAGTYAARLTKEYHFIVLRFNKCSTSSQLFCLVQKSMMDHMPLQNFMGLKSGGLWQIQQFEWKGVQKFFTRNAIDCEIIRDSYVVVSDGKPGEGTGHLSPLYSASLWNASLTQPRLPKSIISLDWYNPSWQSLVERSSKISSIGRKFADLSDCAWKVHKTSSRQNRQHTSSRVVNNGNNKNIGSIGVMNNNFPSAHDN